MSKLGRSEWRSANEEADPVLAVTPVQEQTLQSSKANATAARLEGDFRAAADSYRKATELEPTIPEQWANLRSHGQPRREIFQGDSEFQSGHLPRTKSAGSPFVLGD